MKSEATDNEDVARMVAEAEERGREEIRARVESALRLVSPDHITPIGARQIRAVLRPW